MLMSAAHLPAIDSLINVCQWSSLAYYLLRTVTCEELHGSAAWSFESKGHSQADEPSAACSRKWWDVVVREGFQERTLPLNSALLWTTRRTPARLLVAAF